MNTCPAKLMGHDGGTGGLANDLALRQDRHVDRPSFFPPPPPTKKPKKKQSLLLRGRIAKACLSLLLRGKPAKAEWTLILWLRWCEGRPRKIVHMGM